MSTEQETNKAVVTHCSKTFIEGGDRAVTRTSYWGAFQGLPPTGRTVEFGVIDLIRLEDGRYVEHWAVADMAGPRAQFEGN
jgi:predicted ester cyclase